MEVGAVAEAGVGTPDAAAGVEETESLKAFILKVVVMLIEMIVLSRAYMYSSCC